MTTPYTDSTQLIDGAGEIFEYDASTSINTHASTACTTTVLTVAAGTDPRDYFRAGDVIYTGGEYGRIQSMTATTITLEEAQATAVGTSASIVRTWRLMGATQGGISLETQTSVTERNVDQVLDPVAVKGDKRSASVKVGLVEMVDKNLQAALALSSSQVTTAAGVTTVNVGSSSTTLNTNAFLIIGSKENGDKVTCKIQKAVNTGNVALKFDPKGNSILQLDLRLINDNSRTSGHELFRLKTDDSHDWAL